MSRNIVLVAEPTVIATLRETSPDILANIKWQDAKLWARSRGFNPRNARELCHAVRECGGEQIGKTAVMFSEPMVVAGDKLTELARAVKRAAGDKIAFVIPAEVADAEPASEPASDTQPESEPDE